MATTTANTYPTSGILTQQMTSLYDAFKPQHTPRLISRFGMQFMPLHQLFRSMGLEEAVAGDSWYAWEENRWHQTITVATATPSAGGSAGDDATAGASLNIVLAAGDLDSSNNYYPRVGDIVTMPNENQGYVETITASGSTVTLKVTPVMATKTLGAVAADTVLAITNGAYGAGTGQPTGTRVGATKRTYYTQIFKESVGAEGSELVKEKWYKITDDGRDVARWYTPGIGRAEYLIGLKMDGAFTLGQHNTNTLTVPAGGAGAGNTIYLTQGVIPWVRAEGLVHNYTSGSFSMTSDLDTIGLYLKAQGVTTGYVLLMVGSRLANDIVNAGKDYLDANGTDYTRVVKTYFGGVADLALSVNFTVIKKGDFTYILRPMDSWSDPMTFGATGYNMDKYGVAIPLQGYQDPVEKVMTKNFMTKYMALDGYSRRFEVWRLAGAGGGQYVTDIDKVNYHLRAHIGLQVTRANQMVLLTPSS